MHGKKRTHKGRKRTNMLNLIPVFFNLSYRQGDTTKKEEIGMTSQLYLQ